MKFGKITLVHGMLFVVGIIATAHEAGATLGESATSVESDRMALSAVRRATTAREAYTVHEVKSDASAVREYVSSAGVIFAVAWNGLTHPDLKPLLGSFDGEYRQALRQTHRILGRRHLTVRSERLVVEKWGHMRNQQGRAYVPTLIPSGVSIDEIK